MAFEKIKQAAEERVASGVPNAEAEELKQEEETSDDQAQSSIETQPAPPAQAEEQVDWKSRAEKAETERDNYKQGLLNEKASKRALTFQPKVEKPAPVESEADDEEPAKATIDEGIVRSVIYKDNEKKALRDVVDSKSKLYIPELVDDVQYNEVIAYLPHSIDKSSVDTIHRALRVAVQAWKYDRGINDTPKDSGASAKASIASVKSASSASSPKEQKPQGRKILKSQTGMSGWY